MKMVEPLSEHNNDAQQLTSWAILVSRENFKSSFAMLAAFGGNVGRLASLNLETLLETEIAREKAKLQLGIEDYGIWRSTRGNPDFGVYSAARRGESPGISQLTEIAKHLPALTKALKELVDRFGSVEALDQVCRSYREILNSASQQTLPNNISISASLEAEDVSLCLAWEGLEVRPTSRFNAARLMQTSLSNYDACRLLSARAAERAAMTYYKQLGFSVADVSISQLQKADDRWKDFDLMACEAALDVKNARKSFTSPDTYVEHCVPRFKLDRKTAAEVSIVGVLSDYLRSAEEIIDGGGKCQILGQVNVSEIRKLYRWMRSRFGSLLNLDGLWNQGFLPGWIFEYPDEQYKDRRGLRARVKELLDVFQKFGIHDGSDLPGWLLGIESSHAAIRSLCMSSQQKKLLNDLASLEGSVGIKRPSLYLYAMGFVLEAMLDGDDPAEALEALASTLFAGTEKATPLCLVDTQHYIENLIRMLIEVCAEARRQQLRFQAFQMPHPAILKGRRSDGHWMTLIAYCGGWLEEPFRVKCGASPLFFGRHEVCPACGRLVCDACGFCTEGCGMYLQRRQKIAQHRKEHHNCYVEDDYS